MKRLVLLIAVIAGAVLSANAQEKQESTVLAQGPMAINGWTGKLTVGGTVIEKEQWGLYFSEEELSQFKSGRTLNTVGGIIACAGAVSAGYGLGYMTLYDGPHDYSGYRTAETCLWVGLGVMGVGLIVGIPGSVKMNKAIKNYNQSLSYQPELRLGTTANGIGLAFVF
ncbi:MAG: hypothetical protein IK008_01950 [Bacteroidales bacterium]|nr:hypothetical protein [Bacteroidales bacterium]